MGRTVVSFTVRNTAVDKMAQHEEGSGIVGVDKAGITKAIKDNGLHSVTKGLNNLGPHQEKALQKEQEEDDRMDIDG